MLVPETRNLAQPNVRTASETRSQVSVFKFSTSLSKNQKETDYDALRLRLQLCWVPLTLPQERAMVSKTRSERTAGFT